MPPSSGATSNLAVIAPITITSARTQETYRRNERPQITPIPKLATNPRAATLVTEIIPDHLCTAPDFLDTERDAEMMIPALASGEKAAFWGGCRDRGPPHQVAAVSLYGLRCSGRGPSASSRDLSQGFGPGLRWRPMPEPLDEPLGVIQSDELADPPPRFVEAGELVQVDALLLERPHEAFGDPIALRLADVRRRDGAPQPLHLVDPGVGDVLRTPVAAEGQAPRDVLAEPAEGVADALANGLEGGPAIAQLCGVPADDFVEMMIDGAEEPAPPIALGVEPRRVRAPHHVWPVRDDRAVVSGIAIRRPEAPRREEPVGAHEPQHPLAAEIQPAVSQPGPHLAIALPMEGAGGEDGADRLDNLAIAVPRLRSPPSRRPGRRRRPHGGVHSRPRDPIDGADHGQRIGPLRGATDVPLHRARLFHSSVKPLFSMRSSASSS